VQKGKSMASPSAFLSLIKYSTAFALISTSSSILFWTIHIRIAERFYRRNDGPHRRCVSNETFIACRSSYLAQDALFNKGSLSLFLWRSDPGKDQRCNRSPGPILYIYIKSLIVYHTAYCVRVCLIHWTIRFTVLKKRKRKR
jgi:hypothetical protein